MSAPSFSAEQCLDQLRRFLPVFAGPPVGDRLVVELRALDVPQRFGRPATEAGFFDLVSDAGRDAFLRIVRGYAARPAGEQPGGVYVTCNPVDPVFLARANNALARPGQKVSCDDKHIVSRRWVVIDADPVRPISGVSASEEEKAAARLLIDGVCADLRAAGWAEPMLCDSGNGFHAWYRVDLPADDGGRVGRLLKRLAARHDTPGAVVDTSIFNPSRIIRLPGCWTRKGSDTPDRPHRLARVLTVPNLEGGYVPGHVA